MIFFLLSYLWPFFIAFVLLCNTLVLLKYYNLHLIRWSNRVWQFLSDWKRSHIWCNFGVKAEDGIWKNGVAEKKKNLCSSNWMKLLLVVLFQKRNFECFAPYNLKFAAIFKSKITQNIWLSAIPYKKVWQILNHMVQASKIFLLK